MEYEYTDRMSVFNEIADLRRAQNSEADACPPGMEGIPRPGTWVAFRLNNSFWEPFVDNDDDYHPMRNVSTLRRFEESFQHYVGLVIGVDEVTTPYGDKAKELVLLYLKPAPDDEICKSKDPATTLQHSMAIPVGWQATTQNYGREPLATKTWMPWKNASQLTTCGTRLRIMNVHGSSLNFAMEKSEFSRFEDLLVDDLSTSKDLERIGFPRRTEFDLSMHT